MLLLYILYLVGAARSWVLTNVQGRGSSLAVSRSRFPALKILSAAPVHLSLPSISVLVCLHCSLPCKRTNLLFKFLLSEDLDRTLMIALFWFEYFCTQQKNSATDLEL